MPKPISSKKIFNALKDHNTIVLANNVRISYPVTKGIMKAAKELDAPVIFELARTESNLEGGYTGITPDEHSKRCNKASDEIDYDIWALHADHIGITKGDEEEITQVKELIIGYAAAGYTSFAIDASHLFNFEGKTPAEELAPNIKATTEIAKFIKEHIDDFGLEVEVGEIGKKSDEGMVITTPEEATTYIKALNDAGVKPDVIAIANGSTHGNVYDKDGNPIEQVSIDIEQTKNIAKALRDAGSNVRIAQHGITGTPMTLIKEKFPHGDILKGNVATYWQNLAYDAIKEKDPKLYKEIWDHVIGKYSDKYPGKPEVQVFGKEAKRACIVFKDKIDAFSEKHSEYIEQKAYEEAKKFFEAFNATGTAKLVREAMVQ